MANKGDIYKVALPNGDEYNFKDKYVRENYRALNNNDFDTINVTELNSGNIVNTGAARFLNTINGSISGNAATATKATQDGSGNTITSTYFRYYGATATDGESSLFTSLGTKQYNNALPDGLTSVYKYGQTISICGTDARFDMYVAHTASGNGGGIRYRSGWGTNKQSWRTIIDSATIGSQSVNYATSAGNASTVNNLTVQTAVPANAKFTDHTYNFSGTTFYSGNQNNSEHNANNIQYNGLYYYTSNGPVTSIGASTADGALYAQAYSTSWVAQVAQDYRDGSLFVRGKNNGTWQKWLAVLDTGNVGYNMTSTVNYNPHDRKFITSKSTSAWDAQAYSQSGYVDNVFVTFKPNQTNMALMVGLDSNPSQDASYVNIDYCWYVHNDAKLTMFESGTEIASISGHTTYVAGDELRVEYSGGYIRYYHNGVLCREVARAISGKLYMDSSFHGATSCIYDVEFGCTATNANYAASAEKATQDSDGNAINSTYLKKSGGTMTGQIMTSFKSAIAIGSRQSDATTITDLIADVRYSSGCCGSVSIGTAYKLNDVTIPTGWYNYTWIPHRSGGKNGSADGDNCNYGVLYLSHMTSPSNGTYEVSFSGSTIAQVRMIASFTTAPTTGQVLISDGVHGGIKSSGYTIAKSVPSNAVFTDTTYSAGTGLTLSGTQFSVSSANASTIMNLLTTGSSAPTDNDYYIAQYAGGGTSTTTYHRRPHSALWSYIKGKTDATYLPLAGGTMTGQIVLASTGYKTNSTSGYSVNEYGNFRHQSTNTGEYWVISNNAGTAKLSVYWETGKVVAANDVQSATVLCANTGNSSTAGGLALYGTSPTDYGIAFRGTGNGGKHGYVQGDWAQYHYMAGADNRGWVFNAGASTGVASISRAGHMVLNGSITLGGNAANTSGVRQVYNNTTQSLDFIFVA